MSQVHRVGWGGRYFEDFVIGDVIKHNLGRTITATDNMWFTLLTQNTAPLHFDANYASKTEFKVPLVNSCFTIALVTGQSVADISQNVFANLGWDDVRLPHPLFEGDTVYSESGIIDLRESKSRPAVGVLRVSTIGYNQKGDIVISFVRTLLVYRRGHGPSANYRPEPKYPRPSDQASSQMAKSVSNKY
jgi:itaconyl-CoA hydratase